MTSFLEIIKKQIYLTQRVFPEDLRGIKFLNPRNVLYYDVS